MMNKILLFILLFCVFENANSQQMNAFVIKGHVADTKRSTAKRIYLKYAQNGKNFIDSSTIENGNFSFKGKIAYPVKANLQLKVADSVEVYYNRTRLLKDYAYEFYLDKGTLLAASQATLSTTKLTGSAAHNDMVKLKNLLEPYYNKSSTLYNDEGRQAYQSKDSVAIQAFSVKSRAVQKQIDSIKRAFMFSHPKSGTALDMLQEYTRSSLDPVEVEPYFKKLQQALLVSESGKAYLARLEKSKATAKGMTAPDFTLKDRDGNSISLSSLKGKLVLLDFWGSWCGPCRQSHPHMNKMYALYKDKGFEILGVSNEMSTPEENYTKWTQAMDEDGMKWMNVLNDKEKSDKQNNILSKYAVNAFPTKVLIDKNGVIIKRFVGNTPENIAELDRLVEKFLIN